MIFSLSFLCQKVGRRREMGKSKTPLDQAFEKLLERKNLTEAQWKKEILEQAQFAFFRGQDKELENFVLQRAKNGWFIREINQKF